MRDARVTKHQPLDLSLASLPRLPFASRAELACACLLEKYTPWRAVEGETVHVKVGGKEIDFYLPSSGTWVEYHPITRYEWKSGEASASFGELFRRLSDGHKRELWSAIKTEFACRYYRERRAVLDLSGHGGSRLVHIQSAREFYQRVLLDLSPSPPSEGQFLSDWNSFFTS